MPYSGGESLEQKFIWVQRSCFFLHATLVACSDIEDSLAFKCQTWYSRVIWTIFSFFFFLLLMIFPVGNEMMFGIWSNGEFFIPTIGQKIVSFQDMVFLFCFGLLLSRYWEILRAGGEWGNREWNGSVVSLTQWVWVWANSQEIVKDKKAWCATVRRVAKSWTWLNNEQHIAVQWPWTKLSVWLSLLPFMDVFILDAHVRWCSRGGHFLSLGHSLLPYGVFSHWIDMTLHTSPIIGREWLKMFLGRGMSWGETRSLSLCIYSTFLKNILRDYGRDGLPDELSQRSLDTARFCLLLLFWLTVSFCLTWVWLTAFFQLSFAWTIHSPSLHSEPCFCF